MKYLFILFLIACSSDKAPTYTRQELFSMAKKGAPDLTLVAPKSIDEHVVDCTSYTPACRYGHKVNLKNITMIALFYDKTKDAEQAAKRIKGYTSRNWVFDDVTGEPILERFVVKYLKAKPAF